MKSMFKRFSLIFKGLAMGMAEIIPGVSGGTIAFITGIYEELIDTIKGVDLALFKTLFNKDFGAFWNKLNGNFLLLLLLGMVIGIVSGIFLIGFLLEEFPAPLWSFFFGLIIASAIYIARKIKSWSVVKFSLLITGVIIAYIITRLTPAEGSENLVIVFGSGVIAISALILPGISGSFILLLLGMYTLIRSKAELALSQFDMASISIMLVFLLGCLVGLVVFSRVLSYTFKKYHDQTLAVLTGFMIGSLNKIWPWRNPVSWLNKNTEEIIMDPSVLNRDILLSDEIKIIEEQNVLPSDYLYFDSQFILCVISFVLGFAIVFVLERLNGLLKPN